MFTLRAMKHKLIIILIMSWEKLQYMSYYVILSSFKDINRGILC